MVTNGRNISCGLATFQWISRPSTQNCCQERTYGFLRLNNFSVSGGWKFCFGTCSPPPCICRARSIEETGEKDARVINRGQTIRAKRRGTFDAAASHVPRRSRPPWHQPFDQADRICRLNWNHSFEHACVRWKMQDAVVIWTYMDHYFKLSESAINIFLFGPRSF